MLEKLLKNMDQGVLLVILMPLLEAKWLEEMGAEKVSRAAFFDWLFDKLGVDLAAEWDELAGEDGLLEVSEVFQRLTD